jgi:hypothetical protein
MDTWSLIEATLVRVLLIAVFAQSVYQTWLLHEMRKKPSRKPRKKATEKTMKATVPPVKRYRARDYPERPMR